MVNTFTNQQQRLRQQQQERQAQRQQNDFEILQKFDSHHYDKSNLPPIILPSIPSRMRADTENSRIVMETIII